MSEGSAFLEKNIPCPACGEESWQKKLQSRLYSPAEQESDQHVYRWKWIDPKYEGIQPQFYYLLHCPACYFTDLAADYENPSLDSKLGGLLRIYRNAKPDRKELLKRLSPLISIHPMTFQSAMNSHLAALYIQEIPQEVEYKNLTKLGRLYLRTAWLWREKSPALKKAASSSVISEIEYAVRELEKPLHQTRERLEGIYNLLLRRVKSFSLQEEQEKAHPYQKITDGFQRSFGTLHENLSRLRQFIQQDAAGTLNISGGGEGSYAGFPSYFDFLMSFSALWPGIPMNERDCLARAVKYFTDTYFVELDFDEVEKVLGTSALIVDLHLRLEDYDSALKSISSVYKAGMDGKMQLQKQLREKQKDGKLTEKDKMLIDSKIARIDHVIQKTAERRHEVRDLKMESFMSVIQPILDSDQGKKSDEEIQEKLKQAGIPDDVLEILAEREILGQSAKRDEEEHKGLFSIFGKKERQGSR